MDKAMDALLASAGAAKNGVKRVRDFAAPTE